MTNDCHAQELLPTSDTKVIAISFFVLLAYLFDAMYNIIAGSLLSAFPVVYYHSKKSIGFYILHTNINILLIYKKT